MVLSNTRAQLALLFLLLGALHVFLARQQLTPWVSDLVFAILALLLWLGRRWTACLLGSFVIVGAIGLGMLGGSVLLATAWVSAPRIESWLADRSTRKSVRRRATPFRIAAAAAVLIALAVYAARPTWLMLDSERRGRHLESLSPSFPLQDPATLTPLAARLRRHVLVLSDEIGERSAYQEAAQQRASDYVFAEFREAGYAPRTLNYTATLNKEIVRRAPYCNIEVRLDAGATPEWVVGAHYDSAPGTPGGDDNASGVAVLIETARLLRERGSARPVRFVAFGTEEPPSFGTRDMGSWRYAEQLQRDGVRVHGMLNLEMLGYFNSKPGSQLFPPFLGLFYPDRGDFIGLVGNISSAGLLRAVGRAWREVSTLPAQMTVLPPVLSTVALSDQLNFWSLGYRAVMISDTSYFRYPHYHQADDTAEKLDYERMALETQALVYVLSQPIGSDG